MTVPYAEVIGDPISHSKSPLIHSFWLQKLGLEGEYRSAQINRGDLPTYLANKRSDPWWRGCNVTAPLKEYAADLVGTPSGFCQFVGAVNCIVRTSLGCLYGTNTDVAGVAEALNGVQLERAIVCLIGNGGAARSVLCQLQGKPILTLRILARNTQKMRRLAEQLDWPVEIMNFDSVPDAMIGASVIINATPLGMTGAPTMVSDVIDWLSHVDPRATVFDTVYAPLETELLSNSGKIGLRTIDGLTMLIGQAAPAFELFFGEPAPREHDAELRALLTS